MRAAHSLLCALLTLVPAGAVAGQGRELGRRLGQHATRDQQRRWKLGKPCGPELEQAALLHRIEELGRSPGVELTRMGSSRDLPLYALKVPARPRPGQGQAPLRVLVTAGLHGNETVGPAAALLLVERALRDAGLRSRVELTVLPLLNHLGSRYTPTGRDLNRSFVPRSRLPAVRAVKAQIAAGRFDLAVDLHASVRGDGFFLIGSGAGSAALARRALAALPSGLLLDAPPDSPEVGPYRLRALGDAVTETPGTLKRFLADKGVPAAFTLEAPARLAAPRQVQGMMRLLRSLIDHGARERPVRPAAPSVVNRSSR